MRTLIRAVKTKGRKWVAQYLADPKVKGRAEALKRDINEQRAKGNDGTEGVWL